MKKIIKKWLGIDQINASLGTKATYEILRMEVSNLQENISEKNNRNWEHDQLQRNKTNTEIRKIIMEVLDDTCKQVDGYEGFNWHKSELRKILKEEVFKHANKSLNDLISKQSFIKSAVDKIKEVQVNK